MVLFAAYHHQGERDSGNFLKAYPSKGRRQAGPLRLMPRRRQLEKNGAKVVLGSCQWCHFKYGYDQKGPLAETLNAYGRDYLKAGRDGAAIAAIAGDGFRRRRLQQQGGDRRRPLSRQCR